MHPKDIKFRFENHHGGDPAVLQIWSLEKLLLEHRDFGDLKNPQMFTGRQMNGQDIFVGDIFKCKLAKKHPYSVVIWDERKAKFMLEIIGGEKEGERYAGLTQAVHNEYELVGNTFDNSNLLDN